MKRTELLAIAAASMTVAYTLVNAQDTAPATPRPSGDTVVSVKTVTGDQVGAPITRETGDNARSGETRRHTFLGLNGGADGSMCKKGFGLGGGPTPGVIALDMTPVRELVKSAPLLQGASFDVLDGPVFQPIVVAGGMGYIGVGDGLRLGWGGMGGERHFVSSAFAQDSVKVLTLSVNYNGFLVEKAFGHDRCSFCAGAQIGSGSMSIAFRSAKEGALNAFDRNPGAGDQGHCTASFALFEFHGGVTYAVAPWVHLGGDVSLPAFYAGDGFDAFTLSFATVNPSVRLRVIFGNLG